MLVVLPYRETVTGGKSFWIAKILSVSDDEAILIELKVTGFDGIYKADLCSTWIDPIGALYPVDVEVAKDNMYGLRTPVEEIAAILERK